MKVYVLFQNYDIVAIYSTEELAQAEATKRRDEAKAKGYHTYFGTYGVGEYEVDASPC